MWRTQISVVPGQTSLSSPSSSFTSSRPPTLGYVIELIYYLFCFICAHYVSHYHSLFIFKAKKRSLLVEYGSRKKHDQWIIRMKGVGEYLRVLSDSNGQAPYKQNIQRENWLFYVGIELYSFYSCYESLV